MSTKYIIQFSGNKRRVMVKNKKELVEKLLNKPKEELIEFLLKEVYDNNLARFLGYSQHHNFFYNTEGLTYPKLLKKEDSIRRLRNEFKGNYEIHDGYDEICVGENEEGFILSDGVTLSFGWKPYETTKDIKITPAYANHDTTFRGYNNEDY